MHRFSALSKLILCTFLLLGSTTAYSQLVINEISQGSGGSEEFVELVVAGSRSCTDTCADIRGWIIDDNNGFHGTAGIATGALRFANIPQWQCVPYGTLILVYNGADKNPRITMPDDSTDANNDHIYILKANSSKLERNKTNPTGSDSSYSKGIYTSAASIAQDWGYVSMANNGDAFQTVDPNNLLKSYFSVGYGSVNKRLNIYFAGAADQTNYYMAHTVDDDIYKQANWKAGVANTADETPGAANNTANATWLTKLLTNTSSGGSTDTLTVNICSGQTYFAGGANRSTSGFYRDTFPAQGGCDSIVVTDLRVATVSTSSQALSGCGKVTINGKDFFSNTTYIDTLRSVRSCDSVIRTFTITITQSYRDTLPVCINTGQSYVVHGIPRTTTGMYNDTLRGTGGGCDSIRTVDLRVITPTNSQNTLQDCSKVVYKGKTYTSSTVVRDTVKSKLGCDSVILTVNIIINSAFVSTTLNKVCIGVGQSYPAGGGNQTLPGTYYDTLTNVSGCDSVIITALQVFDIDSSTTTAIGCGPTVINGVLYSKDTLWVDTLLSVNGCDSFYLTHFINIRQNTSSTKQVCINAGETYFVGGANQSTSGIYPDTYQGPNGCDSTVYTDLRVMDPVNVPVCILRGQSYFAQGNNQTTAGIYRDTLTSVGGCDSIVITDLQVVDTSSDVFPINGCGEVIYKGTSYTSDITFDDVVLSTRGCDSIYRKVVITVLPAPSVQIIHAADSVLLGDSLQLSILPGNYTSIVWAPASSLNTTGGTTVFASPKENTEYVVIVTADNGCTASDSFVLNVILPELKYMIPSGFTPNGDGHNEYFWPVMTGSGSVQEMRIYNRWGELIYEGNSAPGWDGTFKNVDQPSGVYVYYIVILDQKNHRADKQQGSVTLIR